MTKITNLSWLLILVTTFLHTQVSCQTIEMPCENAVWVKRYKKLIPKGICIPNDCQIDYIDEDFLPDFNKDGLTDFVFKWSKIKLKDGDTSYVSVYIHNKDSTYTLLKTYSNLYPIYFFDYSLEYKIPNQKLKALQKKYQGENLLHNLSFEDNLVKITTLAEAKAEFVFTYQYDDSIKNWVYMKCDFYDYANGKNTYTPQDFTEKLGNTTLDKFTYFLFE